MPEDEAADSDANQQAEESLLSGGERVAKGRQRSGNDD